MLKEVDERDYIGKDVNADANHKESGAELVWVAGHSASILK